MDKLDKKVRLEGKAGKRVGSEDFFNGIHVGSRSQVKAQIVLHGRLHDSLDKGYTF